MELTRIKNDINGNGRLVVHFLQVLSKNEKNSGLSIHEKYELALLKAKEIGGRKYHNKQYGGGIVFQESDKSYLENQIEKLASKDYKKPERKKRKSELEKMLNGLGIKL